MYYVYVIKSKKSGNHYIGYTSNLTQRLKQHNSNLVRSTKNKGPWKLIYREGFVTKTKAWKREKQIKSYKGGEAFKNLIKIGNSGGVA